MPKITTREHNIAIGIIASLPISPFFISERGFPKIILTRCLKNTAKVMTRNKITSDVAINCPLLKPELNIINSLKKILNGHTYKSESAYQKQNTGNWHHCDYSFYF